MSMHPLFSRSQLILGDETMKRLSEAEVILLGVGGVGSWAAEALVRTGLRHLTIVDFDNVSESNINRQLPATTLTVGRPKTEVMRRHLLEINPEASITAINSLYNIETAGRFDLGSYDYVIDAIDSVRDKALLINNATRAKCRLFSSMGAALKTDPSKIAVAEFSKVTGCRLAAALRRRFKTTGEFPARKFKAVYSPEFVPNKGIAEDENESPSCGKKNINGSLMQITAVFGMYLASLVINDLLSKQNKDQ